MTIMINNNFLYLLNTQHMQDHLKIIQEHLWFAILRLVIDANPKLVQNKEY